MSRSRFPSVRVAGGLLPADLFARVLDGSDLDGLEPSTYQLAPHEKVRDAASRAFDYLTGTWTAFGRELERAEREGRPLTGLTRERWLLSLLRELGFGVVSPTPKGGLEVDDKAFPVSHQWNQLPIHLLGWGTDLDHRTKGVAGAAEAAPQSMMQELLNRSESHLWALVSNGQRLRLLRDSRALAGSAYVEFDIDLIFSEQLFTDFVLLYRIVHASRFTVPDGESPTACWLERWRVAAVAQGERALERLQKGVREAIQSLGTGFLRHPENGALRDSLASGTLSNEDYHRAVLRLVYRMLFWFVAEERGVILDPETSQATAARYDRFFSSRRLRDRARRGVVDSHDDRWEAVRLVFTALGTDAGLPELGIPGIGGLYERVTVDESGAPLEPSCPDALDEPLEGLRLTNGALLTSVRHLAWVDSEGKQRPVDFKNLDSEELGSVYESLLELHPRQNAAERTFVLEEAPGSERKTTGAYYTPSSLTETLLDSALDPLLDEAAQRGTNVEERVESLLSVTVCDPACGSGHFLVAAARRIARRIAQQRSGEDEPSPDLVRAAMREVVSRCIHGVDINEMAAELAKVSLWLESVEPGRPLAFLDANIRVGNALLGTTPALLHDGIPQAAFKALTGDEKEVAKRLTAANKKERSGVHDLFSAGVLYSSNVALGKHTAEITHGMPRQLTDIAVQRRRLRAVDAERVTARRVADAWCAAFVQEMRTDTPWTPITQSALDWIGEDNQVDPARQKTVEMVEELARRFRFFHWHLEFPHIFTVPDGEPSGDGAGWTGGFTCLIGNPPWERVKLQEKEFFAARNEAIATAKNADARKTLIKGLATSDDPADRSLYAAFQAELRLADGWSHLLRESGRYPLTGRGDINTYAVFAEAGRTAIDTRGRVAMVLPTGIATDATTQFFFKSLVETETLVSLYDFENEEKLFEAVHHAFRFCLWTASGRQSPQQRIRLAFRLRQVSQLDERRFELTPQDIELLNPNTGTCPVFDFKRNADITVGIYRRVPVLWREGDDAGNPWGLSFQAMFHMSNDAGLFESRESLEAVGWKLEGTVFVRGEQKYLPLYEAKMMHHFDDRYGTYDGQTEAQAKMGTLPRPTVEQKDDPMFAIHPRYWVADAEVGARRAGGRLRVAWDKEWLLAWRDICRATDERTMINSFLPAFASPEGGALVMLTEHPWVPCLSANLSSHVLDFAARQKSSGTHLKYFTVKQLPILAPKSYDANCSWQAELDVGAWIRERVLELAYTSYAMEEFARDHGAKGAPFRWDEGRRFWLRAELDAAYFHLYGVERGDVDYVMDTFRAFRNNDPERFSRTKQAILDVYDDMTRAIETGVPYASRLDPPPGDGPRHPARPSHTSGSE